MPGKMGHAMMIMIIKIGDQKKRRGAAGQQHAKGVPRDRALTDQNIAEDQKQGAGGVERRVDRGQKRNIH